MTPPNQHAQRVERYTRTADDRKRATLSGLSFVLPSPYEIYLDISIAKAMNDLPNSLTSPLTPTIILEGSKPLFHSEFPFLPFGATCMVQQYKGKIDRQATLLATSSNSVPKAELGVCMGEDPNHRGSYLFVVANGEVVPRRVIQPVNVHPWDWKRKYSPTAELLVPRVPKYNINVQQGVTGSPFIDPTTSFPSPSPIVSTDNAISSFEYPSLIDGPDTPPGLLFVSSGSNSASGIIAGPPSTSAPASVSSVNVSTSSSSLPLSSIVLPLPFDQSLSSPPVLLPPSVAASSLSINPVVLETLPVLSVSSVSSNLVPPELRRSTRIRTPAVPGAHRSYISNIEPDIVPDNWTPVARTNKLNHFIRRTPCLSGTSMAINMTISEDFSYTIPTETVHDMTVSDAISYLSNIQLKSQLSAYAAIDQLRPQAPMKGVEHTLLKAMKPGFVVAQNVVETAVCKHLDMLTEELSTFSLISDNDIQSDCVRVYAQVLIKIKADERVTARLAAGGNRQPLSSHGETFAPTASESSSNLLLAVYQALGKQCDLPVEIDTFDLSNAFQNTILDKVNFPQQILMLMPINLPGKYATYSGKWVEVHKAINGLRQANELFDKDVRCQMAIAGFTATCDSCVYHKQDPINPDSKCSINMHVDDGLSVNTCHQFYLDAINQLTLRWGKLTHQLGTKKLYNGKNIISHTNGAISLSMESYILRATKELGVSHLPPVSSPSHADFFHPSIDTTPVDKKLYARFNGCLTHVTTKGRFDVRKESQYLSKQMSSPTEDDMRKMIQVWQYLNCTAALGPVYDTSDGTQLVLHVDAAFGVNANGASQTGAYLSIGRYNSPIWVMSKQQEDIALSPQASEYFGLSDPLQSVLWHRQLLCDLGFPQERTIVWEDNIPAINLAYSPQITRKSRYMFVRHHFVRSLVQNKVIKICHVDSKEQAADLLTHSLKPTKFKYHRNNLFNLKSLST